MQPVVKFVLVAMFLTGIVFKYLKAKLNVKIVNPLLGALLYICTIHISIY